MNAASKFSGYPRGHFRRWGVTDAIRAASPIPRSYGSGGIATYGTFLSDYHHEWFNRAKIVDYYAATNERLPQYETEAVLRARARDFANITLLTGCSFNSLRQGHSGVEVNIICSEGAETRTLRLLCRRVGDGARSPVREAAGITQEIDPHDRQNCPTRLTKSSPSMATRPSTTPWAPK